MSLTFGAVVLDGADAVELGEFWSAVLGRPLDDGGTKEFAMIKGSDGVPTWMFQGVSEAKAAKNRAHPDFHTDDLDGEVSRLTGLGATVVWEKNEYDTRWITLRDVAGNEFCVVQD